MIKKKISVVTGGAGFLGSHMVDYLIKKGHKVYVIDNFSTGHKNNIKHHLKSKNFKLIKKDITNLPLNLKCLINCHYVFHFAGLGDIVPSISYPEKYFKTNVYGTLKILENIRLNKKIKKIVYAASSSCYGLARVPTNEKDRINPKYPYALTKYMGEELVLHWNKVYKIPVNSIRIFNTYGPRVRTTGAYGSVIGVFFKQKLENKPLTVVGTGNQKRDYLHVKDLVRAFYDVALKGKNGSVYNLGADKPVTIKKLVDIIGSSFTHLPKRPSEPNCTWANINKLKRDTKWKSRIKFEDGVKEMLENISDWKDAPLWNKKKIYKATKLWFKYLK
jgi:UDP-glucose 4-epimerase